ncbi:alpha carbonic anhydrase 4 [Euphorbia peplus]|nr:alpha carbonic anhydrase 4 [Euphorbia peplus]
MKMKMNLAFTLLVSLIFTAYQVLAVEEIGFSYIEASGRGPSKWGQLDPKWKACGIGKLQSPVDISNVKLDRGLGELQQAYKPCNASIVSRGRDIMVSWKGDGGGININGTSFKLEHTHWHIPSEHSINGKRYDLEVHIVHENSQGKIAVSAILYQFGQPDAFLFQLLPFIKSVTKTEKNMGIMNPGIVGFGTKHYYRYDGSLSVPPCTEGVTWTILSEIRTASVDQVRALKDAVDSGYEMDARPIQALNGRGLYVYNP